MKLILFILWSGFRFAVPTTLGRSFSSKIVESALIRSTKVRYGRCCGQSLNVPNSVKVFLWRAFHNLLPTKANLLTRGVVENALDLSGVQNRSGDYFSYPLGLSWCSGCLGLRS
jgi:hypothetical protein